MVKEEAVSRIYSLDLLRFMACCALVIHHYQLNLGIWYEGYLNFFGGRFDFSTMVEFFFILSGFLTRPLNEEAPINFIIRRWIRLMPMAIISAFIYEVICAYIQTLPGNDLYYVDIFGLAITILGISGWGIFDNPWVNGQLWYVSVLLLCYIIYLVIDTASKKLGFNRNICFAGVAILGILFRYAGWNAVFCNSTCGRGYSGFFGGMLLKKLYQMSNQIDKSYKNVIYVAAGTVIGICIYLLFVFEHIPGEGILLSYALYPSLIVFSLWNPIVKIFSRKYIGELGKITFEAYIWHMPVLLVFHIFRYFGYSILFDKYWFCLVFVSVVFIVGAFMHYLVEIPVTRILLDKYLEKLHMGYY